MGRSDRNAVAKAAKRVRKMAGVELMAQTALVEAGRISEYRANVKIAFIVEEVAEG